jgi:hypothetical protein
MISPRFVRGLILIIHETKCTAFSYRLIFTSHSQQQINTRNSCKSKVVNAAGKSHSGYFGVDGRKTLKYILRVRTWAGFIRLGLEAGGGGGCCDDNNWATNTSFEAFTAMKIQVDVFWVVTPLITCHNTTRRCNLEYLDLGDYQLLNKDSSPRC